MPDIPWLPSWNKIENNFKSDVQMVTYNSKWLYPRTCNAVICLTVTPSPGVLMMQYSSSPLYSAMSSDGAVITGDWRHSFSAVASSSCVLVESDEGILSVEGAAAADLVCRSSGKKNNSVGACDSGLRDISVVHKKQNCLILTQFTCFHWFDVDVLLVSRKVEELYAP